MRRDYYASIPSRVRELHRDWADGEYAAWTDATLAAQHQPHPGRFENLAVLKALLGRRGRHVGRLLARGAIVPATEHDDEAREDELYLVGFDEMRRGRLLLEDRLAAAEQALANRRPLSSAERMARSRARQAGLQVSRARYGRRANDATLRDEDNNEDKYKPTSTPTDSTALRKQAPKSGHGMASIGEVLSGMRLSERDPQVE